MTLQELTLNYRGNEYAYHLPEGLHAIKDTDARRRALWCGQACRLMEAPEEPSGAACQDRVLDGRDLCSRIGSRDPALLEMETELERMEAELTRIDLICEEKYRALKATVFQRITADLAARHMRQTEHEIRELRRLSDRRRMDRSWQLPLVCAVLVTIMAVLKNSRLYLVTLMLLGIAALSWLVVKKTWMDPQKAKEQIARLHEAFGADSDLSMRENVRAYCVQYERYLRDWHASYELSQRIGRLRHRLGKALDRQLAGPDRAGDGLTERFARALDQAVRAGPGPIILNDVFCRFDDDSCLTALRRLSALAGEGRQIIILTSSERELNFIQKGWVVPPPGHVPVTPFRLLG